jgi:hypothetical protein
MRIDLRDLEIPKEALEHITQLRAEHAREAGNPLLMIEAILFAAECKVSLPLAACIFILTGFRKWHDAQATISLDEAFGIKSSDGRHHPYRMQLLQDRNEMLFEKVALLKCFGAKTSQAAEMAARGLEECRDWNQSEWDMPPTMEAETLCRLYSKWPVRKQIEEWCRTKVLKWNAEDKQRFLAQFPSDSMPYKVKQALRAHPTKSGEAND